MFLEVIPGSLHFHAGAKSKSGNEGGIRVTERAPVGVSEISSPLTLCLGPPNGANLG